MAHTDDKSKKTLSENENTKVSSVPETQGTKDKADVYDPVGMAGKKAGIVEDLKEENCDHPADDAARKGE